jgi:hypothetical protein
MHRRKSDKLEREARKPPDCIQRCVQQVSGMLHVHFPQIFSAQAYQGAFEDGICPKASAKLPRTCLMAR